MSNYDSNSQPPRVLIVDDHPNTATMLARAIRKLDTPVEILTASSGEDALRQLENTYTDVLITDFIMPGISGLELIKILQEKHKPAHTILLTAFDTPGLSFTSRRLDIQNYPWTIQDVKNYISELKLGEDLNKLSFDEAAEASRTKILFVPSVIPASCGIVVWLANHTSGVPNLTRANIPVTSA